MSCSASSGGAVTTALARNVSNLTEREVQEHYRLLMNEAEGLPSPSEIDIAAWRARQQDLLSRMEKMTDKRKSALAARIQRSRAETVPDGPTFHAWRTLEARTRQAAVLKEIDTALDLEPPGSQAEQYELGEDGRPTRVWYASYGSNLYRDRFMNYIEGGSPEGSSRAYTGCSDPTPPEADIPIRFAGARPHFALNSSVWSGGIAFIDHKEDDPHAQGLGRAYSISISQFDEVVAQENGMDTKDAAPVPLSEALAEGRAVTGPGAYQTIVHIGDYEGAPVLTFTAPFTTQGALTKTGHLLRQTQPDTAPVRMPVSTNKPSAAYLRMIGGGLNEAFGMDEVQQADYLRGCNGGERWTRQQMVRILRGLEPDPPVEPTTAGMVEGKSSTTGKKRGAHVPAVQFSHPTGNATAVETPKVTSRTSADRQPKTPAASASSATSTGQSRRFASDRSVGQALRGLNKEIGAQIHRRNLLQRQVDQLEALSAPTQQQRSALEEAHQRLARTNQQITRNGQRVAHIKQQASAGRAVPDWEAERERAGAGARATRAVHGARKRQLESLTDPAQIAKLSRSHRPKWPKP